MDDPATPSSNKRGQSAFPATRWSLVCAARGPGTVISREALEKLCRLYWHPLYCFVRHRGHSPEEAQDVVQDFFVSLFTSDLFARADAARGRLRGFLRKSLGFFLSDRRKHAAALKRGGGIEFVPFDLSGAEERYAGESTTDDSPEQCYDRRWAMRLLQRASEDLGEHWKKDGKAEFFAALSPFLFYELDAAEAYRIAAQFGMTEGNVKVSLHRLKEDYRKIFRQEVADTLASAADVDEEIAALKAALR